MPDIFLNEAARLSGHDERVIRGWIKKGDLPERKIKVNGRLKHVLDLDAFTSYLQSRDTGYIRHNPGQSDRNDLTAKVADLEQRVSQLEGIVYALQEARAVEMHPTGPPPLAKTPPEREKRPYHRKETTRDDVPPDAITLVELAKELDIDPHTLRDHVAKYDLKHIPVLKRMKKTGAEYDRYFTVGQAEQVRMLHAQIKKKGIS